MQKKDVNHSFRKFLNIIETLLDTYAPLSPLSKADQKRKLKPWITKGLLTSIKKKNQIYKKFCRAKNDQNKHTLHEEFKKYRNTILKLTKINKSKRYQIFFSEHKKNLKKIREGIKSIINISKKSNKTINCIKLNDQEVTHSLHIFSTNFFVLLHRK